MSDPVITIIAALPLVLMLVIWVLLFRREKLRIRTMALTAALAAFLTFNIQSLLMSVASEVAIDAARDLSQSAGISVLVGLAVLSWWPILRKGLRQIKIEW